MKWNNTKNVVVIVCSFFFAACLLLLLPQIRQIIINITEQFVMGRELADHAKWHGFLLHVSIFGTVLSAAFAFLATNICFLKKIANKIITNIRGNIINIIVIVCSFCFVVCLLLLLPQIRQIIINITEQFVMGRELADHAKWHGFLLRVSIMGIVLSAAFAFLATNIYFLRKILNKLIASIVKYFLTLKKLAIIISNEVQAVEYKKFIIPILCMFGLYTLGIISIIRADFMYIDDLGRAINGVRGWNNFSRYISDFLAIFIHTDTHITDISPLPQLIAALFMAAASVSLVYIISGGKITKLGCFLSLPVGLSPYFLECFSYKFDAPYMALSVLVSIVPFLFIRNYFVFSIFSIISILIICMTYQASSGIYIIIVTLLCFKVWNKREKKDFEIFRFAAVSGLSYCVGILFFYIFLRKGVETYVSTNAHSIENLFHGVIYNFKRYISNINADFSHVWKVLFLFILLSFVISSFVVTKRKKIPALIISFIVIGVMCVTSFGVYLILSRPSFNPRAMYGFGIFIACISVYLSQFNSKIFSAPAILLCWCFFVFSFSYGNALSNQKRYADFRTEILLHDLSVLFPNNTKEPLLIKLIGTAGFPNSVENAAKRNPIIRRLVPRRLSASWYWSNIILTSHYNFNLQQDESIEETGLTEIFDSYYHTIKSDGKRLLVILRP